MLIYLKITTVNLHLLAKCVLKLKRVLKRIVKSMNITVYAINHN